MSGEKSEIDKAVEAEDEEIEKAKSADESKDIIICPKCIRPVTEGDYMDKFSETMTDSTISKIECPQCGYIGIPIEINIDDFKKLLKENKKAP